MEKTLKAGGLVFVLSVQALTITVQAVDYFWAGNAVNGNWNNKTNWTPSTGAPTNSTSDNAWFTTPVASTNVPTLSAAATANVVTLSGPTNWTIGGASLLYLSGGLNHASTYTNTFNPKLAGNFGMAITSGVLVLGNVANLYTGNTTITGGVLVVTNAAFNVNVASSAGSNSNPVVLGDLTAGLDAELRIGLGGNRGIAVQGGAGGRTIRFVGGAQTYTNTYTLNKDTVFAPGYLADAPGVNKNTVNSQLTGTGGVVVANGVGIIAIGNVNNNYTGQTKILAGTLQNASSAALTCTNIFGYPQSYGTNAMLLGDTSGTNNATLQFAGGATFTNYLPLHVQAGSSGSAALTFGEGVNNIYPTLLGQLTLDKTLNINLYPSYGTALYLTNVISGPGGLNISMLPPNHAFNVYYQPAQSPAYTGGTVLSGITNSSTYTPAVMYWQYPGKTNDNLLLRFGSNASGGPATMTLNGGQFFINPTASGVSETYTNDNVIVVPVSSNAFYYPNAYGAAPAPALLWSFGGTNGTVYFTGPISLGSLLEFGELTQNTYAGAGHYQGAVTLDQSATGRRELFMFRYSFSGCSLDGNITDGPGAAANSLLLRYSGKGNITYVPMSPLNITGTGSTFANGTVVEGDVANSTFNVASASGSLGLGNFWLLEGGWLRLNNASHVNTTGGATVSLYGNQAAMSVLGLGANFIPALTSDSSGVLAIDTTGYNAISSQASVGNGYMYLGSITNGVFTGGSLQPCPDHVYRLGGGGGTLTIANSVLLGANNALLVGAPCGITSAGGGGYGTVVLAATNTYSGATINANSILQGTAQTSGSPFGNSAAGVTLNDGTLYLSGINTPATNAIGPLTVNGFGNITVNQGNKPTNILSIASLPAQTATTPWVVTFNGSSTTTLGGKERVIITNGAPAVMNGMVSPYLLAGNLLAGSPDFLTYNTNTDAGGVIGFTNAASAYTAVATATNLDAVTGSGIANVTTAVTMDKDTSVYALRMLANINTNGVNAYTLTVGSGGIIGPRVSNNVSLYGNLSFGTAAGVIYCPAYTGYGMIFYGTIQGANGLTVAGARTVNLYGNNSALAGAIAVVGGKLGVTNEFNLGAPSNPICLNGGTLEFATAAFNDNRSIYVGPAGGSLQGDIGATITLGGPVTGPGCLFLNGVIASTAFAITNGNNTYSGGTYISASMNTVGTPFQNVTVTVASNATFGVGDLTVAASSAWLYGDNNIGGGDCYGNNTTNRLGLARLSVEPYGSVYFMSTNPSVGSLSGSGYVCLSNTTLTAGGDNRSTLFDGILSQDGASTGQLVKAGTGRFTFKGLSTLTGTTVVNGGTFVADGSMTGGITVNGGATLAGAGSVGAVTLNSGATFLPGAVATNSATTNRMTTLSAASLAFSSGATMTVNIYGPTNYTPIVANGPVNLGGATLQVNFLYKPAANDVFYILLNNSTNATTGTFAGMSEGKKTALGNGYYGKVSYVATGDATAGNDMEIYSVTAGVAGTAIFIQ